MASKQSTAEFIAEQLHELGNIRHRKMFGEYALYVDEKVVALICDDKLFLKPTSEVEDLLKEVEEAPPYAGAKNYFLISEDYWDDKEYLKEIFQKTADFLPRPKLKKKKL